MLTLCLPFYAWLPLLHNTESLQHFLLYHGSRLNHSKMEKWKKSVLPAMGWMATVYIISSIMSTLAECNTVRQYDRPAVQTSETVIVI